MHHLHHLALDRARVQHNPARCSESARGDVFAKFRPHGSIIAVCSSHFAPDHTELGTLFFATGLVNISYLFPVIKPRVFTSANAINLQQCCVRVLIVPVSLVAQYDTFCIESHWLVSFFLLLHLFGGFLDSFWRHGSKMDLVDKQW